MVEQQQRSQNSVHRFLKRTLIISRRVFLEVDYMSITSESVELLLAFHSTFVTEFLVVVFLIFTLEIMCFLHDIGNYVF